ncbi:WcaI family glycosyltransferase [Mucilaginibacter glaciei]|uniref:WcaI family glycosyltransferase n=1 Tax=Mucilaginibacter glaciei TaxID=2772109 RepID=A0A926NJN8_9SPHI|nr:WcaI family glycosyltransferase [Mucilaginibacter glaciei]MBD1393314.1 WcaI family glycosyltransferase [Mucilaginibacter glaciei]
MNNKRILLISHNFSPEPIGIGKYNGEMLLWLADQGYDCTVITTFPYYPYWKVQAPYNNLWYKKELIQAGEGKHPLTIYRCPSYIPKDPTGKQRAIQDFSYWLSKFLMIFKMVLTRKKFDLIITVAPPFHLAYLGLIFRKLNGGKLLYHIQDMQIEAARDLKLFSRKRILDGLFKVEHNILRRADYVSSISKGMIKKIKQKHIRDVVFFPNWVDTDYFFPMPDRLSLKPKWGFDKDDLVLLYSGAVGVKQGLEGILVTAKNLLEHTHIKFIICASGPYNNQLIEHAKEAGLTNITFLDVQAKEVFNEFLNMADLHLVLQKANAGDLVMPSKLTTILAVGGASIVTASKDTSLYEMVLEHDFGFIVEPGNPILLTDLILSIKQDEGLEIKRKNARAYAQKNLNMDEVMNGFVQNFLS